MLILCMASLTLFGVLRHQVDRIAPEEKSLSFVAGKSKPGQFFDQFFGSSSLSAGAIGARNVHGGGPWS